MIDTLKRSNLVDHLTTEFPVVRTQAADILEDVLKEIATTLAKGDSVKIAGFGTFSVRKKKSRIGRNPKTGITAEITPRTVVTFKASPILKKSVGDVDVDSLEEAA